MLAGGGEVGGGAGLGDEVADQQVGAGGALADGGGRGADAGQGLEGGVDLAEFDAPAAEFDLVVGAADEDEAFGVVAHEVAAAVDARGGEGGVGAELLGVLGGVEVAGGADAGDEEFAGLVPGDGVAGGVDDGDLPAVQGVPMRTGWPGSMRAAVATTVVSVGP